MNCARLVLVFLTLSLSAAATVPVAPAVDPAKFVARIDNPYYPLTPGATFFYEGSEGRTPVTDELYVMPEPKRILGVACTVVRDRVYEKGVLAEETFDWLAQDSDGNVWYFGEDSRELNAAGKVISTEGSWESGKKGAQPGIIMKAHPKIGDRFQQEHAPGVAEDMAEVIKLDASATVKYGKFDSVVVTKEWTPLEPGVVEHKSYARGIGLILEEGVQGSSERLELVRISKP